MTIYTRRELEDALPDYLLGVAPQPLADAIDKLAASDVDFAELLAVERRIADALDAPREFELERAAAHDFTRLRARIQEDAVPRWRVWLQSVARPQIALAAVAVLAVGLVVLPPEDDGFRTLSDDPGQVVGQIRVIFDRAPTASDMAAFEQRYSLRLESGPDMAGSYVFSAPDSRDIEALMDSLQQDESLSFVGAPE